MADFLNGFVKTVMDEVIQKDYPHIRHPALLYAQIKDTVSREGKLYVTLQVLTENGQVDETFPLIPHVRTELSLQAGNIAVIGLLYSGCTPYILGRCLDDIN